MLAAWRAKIFYCHAKKCLTTFRDRAIVNHRNTERTHMDESLATLIGLTTLFAIVAVIEFSRLL
jgi:hypothetical protein